MFVCVECREPFETAKRVIERHGLDTPPYEEYEGCPHCGGWAFVEAVLCSSCGQIITEDYFMVNEEAFCEECCTRQTFDDL